MAGTLLPVSATPPTATVNAQKYSHYASRTTTEQYAMQERNVVHRPQLDERVLPISIPPVGAVPAAEEQSRIQRQLEDERSKLVVPYSTANPSSASTVNPSMEEHQLQAPDQPGGSYDPGSRAIRPSLAGKHHPLSSTFFFSLTHHADHRSPLSRSPLALVLRPRRCLATALFHASPLRSVRAWYRTQCLSAHREGMALRDVAHIDEPQRSPPGVCVITWTLSGHLLIDLQCRCCIDIGIVPQITIHLRPDSSITHLLYRCTYHWDRASNGIRALGYRPCESDPSLRYYDKCDIQLQHARLLLSEGWSGQAWDLWIVLSLPATWTLW